MTCPHCKIDMTLEELKAHISPQEIKQLWSSLGGSTMTEARRQANADRAKKRWASIRAKEAGSADE